MAYHSDMETVETHKTSIELPTELLRRLDGQRDRAAKESRSQALRRLLNEAITNRENNDE